MPKFQPGDLIKPKPNTVWAHVGVILCEVLEPIGNFHYRIHIVVVGKTSSTWHSGDTSSALTEFFEHV